MDPWVRKITWRRKWQPTPVFLPGESHGQRSLAGYSPWGRKESDRTERLIHPLSFFNIEYSPFLAKDLISPELTLLKSAIRGGGLLGDRGVS